MSFLIPDRTGRFWLSLIGSVQQRFFVWIGPNKSPVLNSSDRQPVQSNFFNISLGLYAFFFK